MTTLAPDFRDLVKCLNSAGVRYLVVGGYAVNFHGHHRNTADFDVWLSVDPENAARVSKALQLFGFNAQSVPPSMFETKGPIHVFGRKPFRIDLLTSPSGVDFEDCFSRRVETEIDGLLIPWISLEDLKTNKQASGRTKDMADLENLPNRPLAVSRRAKKRRRRK